jgi:restriction system protein
MILTTDIPATWQQLQNDVGAIWRECGFAVEVESKKATVRGTVSLDIFAEEEIAGRKYSYACECKYWKAAIPQTVVHSFRTVIGDLGINQGYIVSTSGFQRGAYEAADRSNVKLLTWQEWQSEFCRTWIQNHMVPTVTEELDDLFSYTEPLVPSWFMSVVGQDRTELRALRDRHFTLGMLMMLFTPYTHIVRKDGFPELPIRSAVPRLPPDSLLPSAAVLDATGYRDFLELALAHGKSAIQEFDLIKERNKTG